MSYKANKHKNPIAAIYMLKNITNNKVYIGETVDIVHRISQYRNMYRRKEYLITTPIDKAVRADGFDSFSIVILESSNDNEMVKDTEYRRMRETFYIDTYNATDPDLGYNRIRSNKTGFLADRKHNKGYPIGEHAKLISSSPLLAWTVGTGRVMLYLGGRSYCDIHNYKDESMASTSVKKGQPLHGDIMYRLDFGERLDDAMRIVKRQREKIIAFENAGKAKRANIAKDWLVRYINGLNAVNDWCIEFGYSTIDLDNILMQ